MQELRANTQVIVTVGPFVDVGDGFTPQTDIALSGNEAELIKHGSTSVVDISGATWAAVTGCRGYYSLTLTTSYTDTEGMLVVIVQDDSDCLPVKQEYMVLSEAAWDSKYIAKDDGFMDVNIKTIGRADTQETEANNLESACSNYSATRGLAGTAVPAAAADAAGGLAISDAGGLDLDTKLANTNEITAARMGALTDWINGGRLDLILDIIAADTTTDIPAKLLKYIQLLARSDAAIEMDNATELTAINADGGSGAGNFSAQTDAIEAIRDHIADGTNLTEAGGDGDHLTNIGTIATCTNLTNAPTNGDLTATMKASVNTEADTALSDYDPPTKAEMDTGHGLLATEAKQDIIDTNVDTLLTRLSAARAGYLDELNVATANKMAWYTQKAFIALVNKSVFTEASGAAEQFNDSDVSIGTIATAITSDGTYTTRKRMVQ